MRSTATIRLEDNTTHRASHTNVGLDVAKHRLVSKLLNHPRRTRKLLWHAAQIIAIANCYLVSAPCEILRIFMGYSFIMAFARYGTQLHRDVTSWNDSTVIVQLDLLNPSEVQRKAIMQWIDNGGPAGLASIENICSDACVSAVSQQAQAMMRRMRVWGLADKFGKILHHFELSQG